MFCVNCGKKLPDNAAFCGYCGTPLNPARKKPSTSGRFAGLGNSIKQPKAPTDTGTAVIVQHTAEELLNKYRLIKLIAAGLVCIQIIFFFLPFFSMNDGGLSSYMGGYGKALKNATSFSLMGLRDIYGKGADTTIIFITLAILGLMGVLNTLQALLLYRERTGVITGFVIADQAWMLLFTSIFNQSASSYMETTSLYIIWMLCILLAIMANIFAGVFYRQARNAN